MLLGCKQGTTLLEERRKIREQDVAIPLIQLGVIYRRPAKVECKEERKNGR